MLCIVLVLVSSVDFSLILPPSNDSVYQAGYRDGYQEGNRILPWRSFKNGFIAGLFFSLTGAGCVSGVNYFSPDLPDYTPTGKLEYRAGFYQGYKHSTAKKKAVYSAVGGLIGTCCNVACVVFTLYWVNKRFR